MNKVDGGSSILAFWFLKLGRVVAKVSSRDLFARIAKLGHPHKDRSSSDERISRIGISCEACGFIAVLRTNF